MKKWHLKFASFEKPDDILDAVIRGEKTIETRPVSPESIKNPANYEVGDILVLESLDSGKTVAKEVTFVHVYDSVEEMAKCEDPSKIFPGAKSADGIIEIFEKAKEKWGKSYGEKIEKYGIVAVGIK